MDDVIIGDCRLVFGDCIEKLKSLPESSIDSICTDPPYNINFMGRPWDNITETLDPSFGCYLAGFTDGEGRFRVHKEKNGGYYACHFSIKTRRDDRAILDRIQRYCKVGRVSDVDGDGNSKPLSIFMVDRRDDCVRIRDIFTRFPLKAKKARDFAVWSEALDQWLVQGRGNKWSGPADKTAMRLAYEKMKLVREYVSPPWSGHAFQDWCRAWATECLRVLKPGGHMLAFSGTRTYHRMTCAIEDAGFEIRDQIGWTYGTGWPKGQNIAKAIGKESVTDEEKRWGGWNNQLKPAWEPICMARKPMIGTNVDNVLAHGTGAINVDACRVPTDAAVDDPRLGGKGNWSTDKAAQDIYEGGYAGDRVQSSSLGRYPANLIHDGSDEVLACFPDAPGQQCESIEDGEPQNNNVYGKMKRGGPNHKPRRELSPSAARFFYCAKPSRRERGVGNNHVTVKPLALMRYLCRLVTQPGGLVLDPFMGSATTALACHEEGFKFIGIENNEDYFKIAVARCSANIKAHKPTTVPQQQVELF